MRRRSPKLAGFVHPAEEELETGFGRRKTGESRRADELGAASAIEVSTRGTLRSDCWHAENLTQRSSHLKASLVESLQVKQSLAPLLLRRVMFVFVFFLR